MLRSPHLPACDTDPQSFCAGFPTHFVLRMGVAVLCLLVNSAELGSLVNQSLCNTPSGKEQHQNHLFRTLSLQSPKPLNHAHAQVLHFFIDVAVAFLFTIFMTELTKVATGVLRCVPARAPAGPFPLDPLHGSLKRAAALWSRQPACLSEPIEHTTLVVPVHRLTGVSAFMQLARMGA